MVCVYDFCVTMMIKGRERERERERQTDRQRGTEREDLLIL